MSGRACAEPNNMIDQELEKLRPLMLEILNTPAKELTEEDKKAWDKVMVEHAKVVRMIEKYRERETNKVG